MITTIIGMIALFVSIFLLGVQYGMNLQEQKEHYTMVVYNALERLE